MILNIKNYRHFKIESIQDVLIVIRKDAFMASIDLKDVFYYVPVAAHHQKDLKFFENEYLKLTCMSNENLYKGYESTISLLRMQGHTSVVYVDDSCL